jgi:hypothetical protein
MSSKRHFAPYSRTRLIHSYGGNGMKRGLMPIKITHTSVHPMMSMNGRGSSLLLSEDLGATDLGGTGVCPCEKKGKGFGVPTISPKLVDKLQKLSIKSIEGVKKRKNVGSIF